MATKKKNDVRLCVFAKTKNYFLHTYHYTRDNTTKHMHTMFFLSVPPSHIYVQEEAAIKKSWQRKIYQKNKQRSEWERKNQLEPAPAAKKSIDEIVCSPWIGLRLASTLWISFMQREIYICGAGDALLIWSSMLMHVTTAKKMATNIGSASVTNGEKMLLLSEEFNKNLRFRIQMRNKQLMKYIEKGRKSRRRLCIRCFSRIRFGNRCANAQQMPITFLHAYNRS